MTTLDSLGLNMDEIEIISHKATHTLAAEYRQYNFQADPPRITEAMVRIVLEATKEVEALRKAGDTQ